MKKCHFCKEEIADNAVVCPYCGRRQEQNSVPPSEPSKSNELEPLGYIVNLSTLPKSPKAIERFEFARNIETKDGDDREALIDQASELALAIKEANGSFPAARAFLGLDFIRLGDFERARRELDIACQEDKSNVMARTLLIALDVANFETPYVPTGGSLTFVLGGLLAVGGTAQHKLNQLNRHIDELVKAYSEDIKSSTVIEYWIRCAEDVLRVHDLVQDIKGLRRKDRLAKAVVNTPWEKIAIPPRLKQEVDSLKKKAEGRAYLASQ